MRALNPNWSDALYPAYKKVLMDYATGKEGHNIRSFGQFLVHSADLKEVSGQLQRNNSPWLNKPLNALRSDGLGDPNVVRMLAAVEAARQEWTTFINSGYAPDEAQNARAHILMDDTKNPSQIMGALGVMGDQAIGRLDQLNEGFKAAADGDDYPNLIPPMALEAGKKLGLGAKMQKYKSGGTYAGGGGAQLQNLHTNPQTNQTIGWNGTTWVDQKTGQPVANSAVNTNTKGK
jgi:hypothetical protein